MIYYAKLKDGECRVEIDKDGDLYRVTIDGESYTVDAKLLNGPTMMSLIVDKKCYEIAITNSGKLMHVATGGEEFEIELRTQLEHHRKTSLQEGAQATYEEIRAPMPGVVVSVEVGEGDLIEPGAPVVIVEAMKMQNEISTLAGGRVGRVLVKPGDVVESKQTLVVINRA